VGNSTVADTLDVYRDWLGIREAERPLSYYQLLRLKQFEDDPAKVRSHYRKMNAHVRKYATGDYSRQSQDLLNELAKSMLCLTDARRKAEYDASLGRKDAGERRRRTLEEILLLRKIVDAAKIKQARQYADAIGLDMRDAVLQKHLAPPEVVMQAYAESIGLPYVDLEETGIDEDLVGKVPVRVARQYSCVPVMVDDGQLLVASPNPVQPHVEDDLRLRTGWPVRSVLCTPAGIHQFVEKYYPREAVAAPSPATSAPPSADQPPAEKRKGLLGRLFGK
jgi:hypothetical protein